MYNIEQLVNTFEEHAVKSKEMNEKLITEWKENRPEEPIPEFYLEEFCFPLALQSICKEILHIKERLGMCD